MKREDFMQADQLEKFAQFLEEHPGFSPLLMGEDAVVCGFQVGNSHLSVAEMDKMISVHPHFDRQQVQLLLAPSSVRTQ